jgi:hypothetical protein
MNTSKIGRLGLTEDEENSVGQLHADADRRLHAQAVSRGGAEIAPGLVARVFFCSALISVKDRND